MIINFDKRGGGSGGVTTGQVESMISELAQGYYTASTYSALTAITGTKDGDVGIVGGGSQMSAMTDQEFISLLSNLETDTASYYGKTIVLVGNSAAEQPSEQSSASYSWDDVYFGVGWQYGIGLCKYVYDETEGYADFVPWDGSPYQIQFPTSGSAFGDYVTNLSGVVEYCTAYTVEGTSITEYQKMYGEWSPMYKQVAISQADYDLIQTKDPNTIYNITGTTS